MLIGKVNRATRTNKYQCYYLQHIVTPLKVSKEETKSFFEKQKKDYRNHLRALQIKQLFKSEFQLKISSKNSLTRIDSFCWVQCVYCRAAKAWKYLGSKEGRRKLILVNCVNATCITSKRKVYFGLFQRINLK